MTQKKRLILSASFTLLTLALVVIKLIRWHIHEFFPKGLVVFIFAQIATFLCAAMAIITFWLPPKPKFVFGRVALFISVLFLLGELSALGLVLAAILFGAKPVYTGIDPLFSWLITAQTAVAMALGRKKRQ